MKKQKRRYEKPSLTRVVLNPAQAVLSICSTTGTSGSTANPAAACKAGACRKGNNPGKDSNAPS